MFDSTGEFTISAEKALEKLAHSQLPDPAFWILKILQFATVHGASNGRIAFGRTSIHLQLTLRKPVSFSQIRGGLGTVKSLEDPALEHLVTGLRALGGRGDRKFALRLMQPDCSEYLLWDGQNLSARFEEGRPPFPGLHLEVRSSKGLLGKLVDAFQVSLRTNEGTVLKENGFTVPFPLLVDGSCATFQHEHPPKGFCQPVVWDCLPDEKGPILPRFFRDEQRTSADPSYSLQTPVHASVFWCVHYHYVLEHKPFKPAPRSKPVYCPSSLHFLKDGVVVRTDRFSVGMMGYSLELFVDASDCPTDLGGLNLRQTREYLSLRYAVTQMLEELTRKTGEQLQTCRKLWGKTLGSWESFVTMTSHLPLSGSVHYTTPGILSNRLNALPRFRRHLLRRLKNDPPDLTNLKL